MNEIIKIESTSLISLKIEVAAYEKKGCKLFSNSYTKELVVDGVSSFRYCQHIEVHAPNVIAVNPVDLAKCQFKKGLDEHTTKHFLREIVASCKGCYTARDITKVLAASLGWNATTHLQTFVRYTLWNSANRGELLKERRGSRNYYRRKTT